MKSPSLRYVVGSIKRVDDDRVVLRCVSAGGKWKRGLLTIRRRDVTRLSIGGASDLARWLVAGPEPDEPGSRPHQPGSEKEHGQAHGQAMPVSGSRLSSIRSLLGRMRLEGEVVRVSRSIPGAEKVEGVVTGVGQAWVALARIGNGPVFDGWTLLRVKDIRKVSPRGSPGRPSFEVRALLARSLWPSTSPAVSLDDVAGAIRSIAAGNRLLVVSTEYDSPDRMWIGSVRSVDDRTLSLLEVDTRGMWKRGPRPFDAEDITRLDFGGGYEEALQIVAGPPLKA